MEKTEQISRWVGDFGNLYTNRNNRTLEEMDEKYIENYGITRTHMNKEFISDMDRDIRILEVGCNIANQLLNLQRMGFTDLWGIEISVYAIDIAKNKTQNINVVKSSALNIPFKDSFFDLVFTSGVLIHINPEDLPKAMDEIYRVSKKYIWGFEYFSEKEEEIEYRGNKNLLWRNNFMKLYLDRYPNLKVVKEKKFKYTQNDNKDNMFLLEKR